MCVSVISLIFSQTLHKLDHLKRAWEHWCFVFVGKPKMLVIKHNYSHHFCHPRIQQFCVLLLIDLEEVKTIVMGRWKQYLPIETGSDNCSVYTGANQLAFVMINRLIISFSFSFKTILNDSFSKLVDISCIHWSSSDFQSECLIRGWCFLTRQSIISN